MIIGLGYVRGVYDSLNGEGLRLMLSYTETNEELDGVLDNSYFVLGLDRVKALKHIGKSFEIEEELFDLYLIIGKDKFEIRCDSKGLDSLL